MNGLIVRDFGNRLMFIPCDAIAKIQQKSERDFGILYGKDGYILCEKSVDVTELDAVPYEQYLQLVRRGSK